MKFILNTVRVFDNDQAREHYIGTDETLKEKLAVAWFNPKDLENLSITKSLNVNITSQHGSVVLKQQENDSIPEGLINVPVSIWSNQITGTEDEELLYKNIEVMVEATRDPILSLDELIKKLQS